LNIHGLPGPTMLYIAIAGELLLCRESRLRGEKVVEAFIHKHPLSMHGGGAEPRKMSEKKVARRQFRSVPM